MGALKEAERRAKLARTAALVRGFLARRRVAEIRKIRQEAAKVKAKRLPLRKRLAKVSAASNVVASCVIKNAANRKRERAHDLTAAVGMVRERESEQQSDRDRGGDTDSSRGSNRQTNKPTDPQTTRKTDSGKDRKKKQVDRVTPRSNKLPCCFYLIGVYCSSDSGASLFFLLKRGYFLPRLAKAPGISGLAQDFLKASGRNYAASYETMARGTVP